MAEGHDPALDRSLAAMVNPKIPRALVARMIAEIPRLPQCPPDEGAQQFPASPQRARRAPRLVRWGGLGVAIAASVCAVLLFPRLAVQTPVDASGPAAAPAQAPAPPLAIAGVALHAAKPRPALAEATRAQRHPAAEQGADDAPPVREGQEAPLVVAPQEEPAAPVIVVSPPASAASAEEHLAATVTATQPTVRQAAGVEADIGADGGTAIPALPAGPRAPASGMGFDGMGSMGSLGGGMSGSPGGGPRR